MTQGMAPRQGILSLTIKDKAVLYSAYMPFLQYGGLFVPTNKAYDIGDEVFMLLTLMDEPEKIPIAGKVPVDNELTFSGSLLVGPETTGRVTLGVVHYTATPKPDDRTPHGGLSIATPTPGDGTPYGGGSYATPTPATDGRQPAVGFTVFSTLKLMVAGIIVAQALLGRRGGGGALETVIATWPDDEAAARAQEALDGLEVMLQR